MSISKTYFTTLVVVFRLKTTCRKTMLQLSADELQRTKNAIHDKQIFLIVDESTLSGIQYLNMIVESRETPHVNCLYVYQSLPCAPNTSIAQAVDDAIKSLGFNKNSFCPLLSDAARYMLAAEAILRFLYSKLFYVTCGTRLLHSCAMAVKFHFEDVI